MQKLLNKYLENQIRLDDLKTRYLNADGDILDNIKSVAAEQKSIFFENEEILKKTVYYYQDSPWLLNDDIYLLLLNFSKQLTGNNNHKDNIINYKIHTILYEYAQKTGNINFIIESSYYKGMSLYNLFQHNYKELVECFNVVEQYIDYYFELDKERRLIFNRSFNNLVMAYNRNRNEDYLTVVKYAKKALAFWDREDVRNFDPDFPYNTFIFATSRNITVMVDIFRNKTEGIQDQETKELILDRANYVYERYEQYCKETLLPVDSLCVYAYNAIRYHLGLITLDELLDELEKISYPLDADYYSLESKSRAIRITTYMLFYMDFEGINHKYSDWKKKIMERVNNYIFKMKISSFDTLLRRDLEVYLEVMIQRLDGDEVLKNILDITLLRHLPTYIHSLMVAEISKAILETVISKIPEYFSGILGFENKLDVIKNKDKLLDIINKSSLLHDIGKLFYVNEISNFGRKVTSIEFDFIKEHPVIGYKLLKKSAIKEEYSEAALYHHVWYDQTSGYPKTNNFETPKLKPLTDIIAIADAIDAATDTLGRPYADGKTLSELLQELKAGAGSRYSPVIVNLIFNDQKLKNKIELFVTEERKNITVKAIKDFNNSKNFL